MSFQKCIWHAVQFHILSKPLRATWMCACSAPLPPAPQCSLVAGDFHFHAASSHSQRYTLGGHWWQRYLLWPWQPVSGSSAVSFQHYRRWRGCNKTCGRRRCQGESRRGERWCPSPTMPSSAICHWAAAAERGWGWGGGRSHPGHPASL